MLWKTLWIIRINQDTILTKQTQTMKEVIKMPKLNKDKSSCKDVFNAFMLSKASYTGNLEFPIIRGCDEVPTGLIPFSKIISSTDYDNWIHFYEYDHILERLWNYPDHYLPYIKKFKGIITPDFSLYCDMPLQMQINNIFRSRQVGNWLQNEGIAVIPNIRFGDSRTYKLSCMGVSKNSTIAISSYGSVKTRLYRDILDDGLPYIFENLTPKNVILYGSITDVIQELEYKYNSKIWVFPSDCSKAHSSRKEVS
ncbi:MAG TPA: hypothetical protein DCG85_00940 [Lachnospiraceae bacterium]|nr:hypothetical protein [Lachnospiraceae bacterium]